MRISYHQRNALESLSLFARENNLTVNQPPPSSDDGVQGMSSTLLILEIVVLALLLIGLGVCYYVARVRKRRNEAERQLARDEMVERARFSDEIGFDNEPVPAYTSGDSVTLTDEMVRRISEQSVIRRLSAYSANSTSTSEVGSRGRRNTLNGAAEWHRGGGGDFQAIPLTRHMRGLPSSSSDVAISSLSPPYRSSPLDWDTIFRTFREFGPGDCSVPGHPPPPDYDSVVGRPRQEDDDDLEIIGLRYITREPRLPDPAPPQPISTNSEETRIATEEPQQGFPQDTEHNDGDTDTPTDTPTDIIGNPH
ncbi:uncharacterized protein VTP21DRAFT_11462 [Calcarisporiella thermophila]|uniref:uncharacterized protein n=1 Tax=Calcarisporiella thermophila TaxID=911321 RepID=UPI0037435317